MDNTAVKRRIVDTSKRRLDVALTDPNIVTFTAVSIFLPYVLTAIILIFLSAYIIINKRTRQLIFIHSGSGVLKLFFVYTLAVPFMYRNWMGLAVGAAVILGLVLGLYLRSVMTHDLYEKILTLICNLSLTSAGYAILEALFNYIYDGRGSHRISAVFFYPNYFATVVAIVLIICAYKILTSKESKWLYYVTAGLNMVSIYLSMSMFAWVEVFIGITVLLAVLHRRRLLGLWVLSALVGAFLIFFMDINLIPRLSDVEVTVRMREQIWEQTIGMIKESPLLGHGFLSYGYLFGITYNNQLIPHSHSIYLDLILNFGIIGSILFLYYFARYYFEVIKAKLQGRNGMVPVLILSITAAALVHGVTDITLLWIQTFPLFLIILSGQGPEIKAALSKNENSRNFPYPDKNNPDRTKAA